MNRKKQTDLPCRLSWLCIAMLLLGSCSTESAVVDLDDELCNEPAVVTVIDMSVPSELTRAAHETLTQFSLTVLNPRGNLLMGNVFYEKNETGWSHTPEWNMSTSGTMKAFCVSPQADFVTDNVVNKNEQHFEYTVPTTEQTMVKVGSDVGFTYASTKNNLLLRFFNALAFLNVRAKNNLKLKPQESEDKIDVDVYVKSVTIHNVKAHGRFDYSTSVNSSGSWTLYDDVYRDYAQDMASAVHIDNILNTDLLDSAFVVMPQTPTGWTPAGKEDAPASDAISVADEQHNVYFELKCQITAEIDGQTRYLWGSADGAVRPQYESIFVPYTSRYATAKWGTMNTNGVYNIVLSETTALDEFGKPIKPKDTLGGGDAFQNAEFVNFGTGDEDGNDMVDDWPAATEPEVISL